MLSFDYTNFLTNNNINFNEIYEQIKADVYYNGINIELKELYKNDSINSYIKISKNNIIIY